MSIRKQYGWPLSGQVNLMKLFSEDIPALTLSVGVEGGYADPDNQVVHVDYLDSPSVSDEQAISAKIRNHDPVWHKDALIANADSLVRNMLRGLGRQQPRDAAYALMGRAFKFTQTGVIDVSIDTEQEATAYVASMPTWSALPNSAKNFLADLMQAMIVMFYVTFSANAERISDD